MKLPPKRYSTPLSGLPAEATPLPRFFNSAMLVYGETMPTIEFPTLINWTVAGFIGMIFGFATAYFTYRLERRRDELKWKQEIAKLIKEFDLQAEQRQKEREQEKEEQKNEAIRVQLLRGLDEPAEA